MPSDGYLSCSQRPLLRSVEQERKRSKLPFFYYRNFVMYLPAVSSIFWHPTAVVFKEINRKKKYKKIRYKIKENNNQLSRYVHKIEISLVGIEHLSKEKKGIN